MGIWLQVRAAVDAVPSLVWVGVSVLCALGTAVTWTAAKRRARRAGERAAEFFDDDRLPKDRLLTVATIVPALFFFVMVLAGSFHGLVAFGSDTLGWHDGWQLLVPATLDGVSLAFAMLAFRAVRKKRSPDRSHRVVWAAAMASATVNFGYEYGKSGNIIAGGYVGLLSLLAMFMFDEFLAQFEEGAQSFHRDNPKFGMRWLTWPSNTFLAAVAWRNHPPAEGTPGTVLNAIANLDRVRASKRSRGRVPATPTPAAARPVTELSPTPNTATHAVVVTTPARPTAVAKATRGPARPGAGAERAAGRADGDVRVPATATTVAQWVQVWTSMCADAGAAGPLTDDDYAMRSFGVRARTLRNIRYAATTGALRRRAAELDVPLPPGYVDDPSGEDSPVQSDNRP